MPICWIVGVSVRSLKDLFRNSTVALYAFFAFAHLAFWAAAILARPSALILRFPFFGFGTRFDFGPGLDPERVPDSPPSSRLTSSRRPISPLIAASNSSVFIGWIIT